MINMRKAIIYTALVALCVCSCSAAIGTSSYITDADLERLQNALTPGFSSKDLPSLHYSVLGYNLLGTPYPKVEEICKFLIESAKNGKTSAEALFQVTSSWKALGGKCSGALPVLNSVKTLNEVLASNPSIQDTYFAVSGLVSLGQKPQNIDKIITNLQSLIKKNDSLINLGFLFNVASLLGNSGSFAFDRIEDAIVQADEVDHIHLQFEGGLSVTALIINGAYRLGTSLNKAPPLTPDQTVKFANYLLSRRSVQTPKGIYHLLEVFSTLTTNKFHIPLSVTLASHGSVSTEEPFVNIRVSDILGNSVGNFTVTAESVTKVKDNIVTASNVKFKQSIVLPSVYSLNLIDMKPERGSYKLAVSASLLSSDPRIQTPVTTVVTVRVTCAALIDFVQIGSADVHQATPSKLDKVEYPKKLSGEKLELDTQQKFIMKFNIKDKSNNQLMFVHQCFVRFYNVEHDVEVVFVVEHDSALQYKFDLLIGDKASEFDHVTGDYSVDLIIGDAILSNSFSWRLADSVTLTFINEPSLKSHRELYQPKPEIKHLFREAEKRPPLVVSNVFTGLLILPLIILFALWIKIGVNVSSFPFTLSALAFHAGLACILLLFGWFWIELNMFQTVKYLLPLCLFTFLTGNRVLRHKSATASS